MPGRAGTSSTLHGIIMKTLFIIGLSLVGGVGGFLLLNWLRPEPVGSHPLRAVPIANPVSDQNNAEQQTTSELQLQVQQLALEVAALRRQIASAPVASASSTHTETDSSRPSIDMHTPEARAQVKQEHHERIADVEAEFRSEGRDPRWSTAMEGSIRDTLRAAHLTQGDLQNVECQSKTCRVDLAVKDPVEFSQEIPRIISGLAAQLHGSAMDFIDNPGGGHSGVLYLFR